MNNEKMREAAENYLNGNFKDFRKQVERFRKFEIVDLILFVEEYYSEDIKLPEFKYLIRTYLWNGKG